MRQATRLTALLVAILLVAFVPATGQDGKSAKEANLDNLQTALNGEFTARARYRDFAARADEEGHGEVASLFRACARAEEIHAGRIMALIQARGGSPMAMMDSYDVKSTKENLEQAYLWEKKERDQLYPAFAEAAHAAGDKHAAADFELITNAEIEHANLCRDAANHLGELTGESKSYWVCRGCGYTTPVHPKGACPFCKGDSSKMVEVN